MSDAGRTETKDWTVTEVRIGKVKNNPHGGQLQAFYVDFEGANDVYWQRKAGNNPQVGESYYGYIEEGEYGPRFKQEKLPEDYSGAQSKGGSTEYVAAPANTNREASIFRQVAAKILAPLIHKEGLTDSVRGKIAQLEEFFGEAGNDSIPTKAQVAEAVELVKETFPGAEEIPAEEPKDEVPFA